MKVDKIWREDTGAADERVKSKSKKKSRKKKSARKLFPRNLISFGRLECVSPAQPELPKESFFREKLSKISEKSFEKFLANEVISPIHSFRKNAPPEAKFKGRGSKEATVKKRALGSKELRQSVQETKAGPFKGSFKTGPSRVPGPGPGSPTKKKLLDAGDRGKYYTSLDENVMKFRFGNPRPGGSSRQLKRLKKFGVSKQRLLLMKGGGKKATPKPPTSESFREKLGSRLRVKKPKSRLCAFDFKRHPTFRQKKKSGAKLPALKSKFLTLDHSGSTHSVRKDNQTRSMYSLEGSSEAAAPSLLVSEEVKKTSNNRYSNSNEPLSHQKEEPGDLYYLGRPGRRGFDSHRGYSNPLKDAAFDQPGIFGGKLKGPPDRKTSKKVAARTLIDLV